MKVKLLHVFIAILIVFLLLMYSDTLTRGRINWTLDGVENYVQDTFLQKEGEADTRIAIIAIDDESLSEIGKWPWNREVHAQLLRTLAEGHPAVIGVDVILSEASSNPKEDESLADAIKEAGNVVLPQYGTFDDSAKAGTIDAIGLSEPVPVLKDSAAALGHINTIPDNDGIVRKSLYRFNYQNQEIKSFSSIIYQKYLEYSGESGKTTDIPMDAWNRFFIPYTGGPGEYEVIPYSMVLNGDVPPDYFEDRIVLIGPYTVGIDDYYYTPLAHKSQMFGVEIHANIIQSMLDGNFKKELAIEWNAIILILAGIIFYFIYNRLHPALSFGILALFIVLYIYIGKLLYQNGLILSFAYILIFLITSYIATLAFNYIKELLERRRVTDVFGRYVAPQVVDEILKNGEEGLKLGGSRRELTVMFVDIRGFTPLSEKAEPEEVVEILNEYLDLTSNCIFQYGGTLDKFIGDATMAIYNAPLLLEDHAFKAIQSAWAMKQGSIALEQKLIERFGFGVKFGVGINTGPAVFGNIGSKTRMDYTAIGDTVNTAARLESNSKPGQIILSEATYELVKDRVIAKPLGGIKVKGKELEILIYELEGIL